MYSDDTDTNNNKTNTTNSTVPPVTSSEPVQTPKPVDEKVEKPVEQLVEPVETPVTPVLTPEETSSTPVETPKVEEKVEELPKVEPTLEDKTKIVLPSLIDVSKKEETSPTPLMPTQSEPTQAESTPIAPLSGDLPVSPLAGVEFKPVGMKSDTDTVNQKSDISIQYGTGEEKGKESTEEPYKIFDLLDKVIALNASDLHLTVGYPPYIRVDGRLILSGSAPITPKQMEKLLAPILGTKNQEQLEINKEVDFSYGYGEFARFRINAFCQRNTVAAALRLIPTKIPTLEELYMPKALEEFTKLPQGFVLVVGPTGSGKSTTLAAMLNLINTRDSRHIITVEDPIEYVYPIAKSIVEQREVSQDTHSWDIALRSALREDPNVVLVGEMRDYETIAAALTVAETGHLVFATLHTNSASQAVDRIIHVFPAEQQAQIRIMLANVITAVVSQRLIPTIGGGRRAAFEILVGTSAVANMIREAKEHLIDNVIQTSADVGMMTMEKSLVDLIREGKITVEDAQNFTTKPEELMRLINKD